MAVAACVAIATVQGTRMAGQAPGQGGRGGGAAVTSFPAQQRPPADPAVVARGNQIYGIECRSCHGNDLRGGDVGGPNLLRSDVVLADQNGEMIQPIIAGSRQAQGMPAIRMSSDDVQAVAAYVHSIAATSRGQGAPPPGPTIELQVLVGDAKAGEAYFGAKCSGCHSASGDLASIGTRVSDPMELQNLWVAGSRDGRGGRGRAAGPAPTIANRRPRTATVLLPSGQKIEGRLDRIDDFFITVTPDGDTPHTFRRDGDMPKIEVHDPLDAHVNLLKSYTNKDIHDVTAYLATLRSR